VDESSQYTSKTVANKVKGISLIVDGHSHSVLNQGLKAGGTLIVSAGEYLEHIGVVTIAPDGSMKAKLIDASGFSGTDPAVDDLIDSYSK
jgi:2',3'-cyclic-nucleotide 2'-phosphodiesterase (5'-nucleotidase family)